MIIHDNFRSIGGSVIGIQVTICATSPFLSSGLVTRQGSYIGLINTYHRSWASFWHCGCCKPLYSAPALSN